MELCRELPDMGVTEEKMFLSADLFRDLCRSRVRETLCNDIALTAPR